MAQGNTGNDDGILRDLTASWAAASGNRVSVGVLRAQGDHVLPPHCLRTCLRGDPARARELGCPALRAAMDGTPDASVSAGTRCEQGFDIRLQGTQLSSGPAVLFTVEGQVPEAAAPAALLAQLDAATDLVQRVEQLIAENAGFAEEVLRTYEQLSILFGLTQQVADVTDVQEIEELLLRQVARVLAAEAITVFAADGQQRAYEITGRRLQRTAPAELPSEVRPLRQYVHRTRQVQIAPDGPRQLLAGPLTRLEDRVDIVVAARGTQRGAYTAGDAMLVESILSFGSKLISHSELHQRLRHMSYQVTRALVAAIDKKDHYTSGHSERGGLLTRLTAAEMGLSTAQQQTMEWAGLLHDIGKIGIPEEILCKPGKLTPEEFAIIKQHPRMGYEILKPIEGFDLILDGVLYHHEYPDGTGYPEGLKGDEIPLVARIIHVVDTFDALTSTRAYRRAFTLERAMEIIREDMGPRIDVECAEAFFRAFERYQRESPDDFAGRFGALRVQEECHAPE